MKNYELDALEEWNGKLLEENCKLKKKHLRNYELKKCLENAYEKIKFHEQNERDLLKQIKQI